MKINIQENTKTRLRLKLRPIYLAFYFIFGFLFFFGGIWVVTLLGVGTTIKADSDGIVIERALLGYFNKEKQVISTAELTSLKVEDPTKDFEPVRLVARTKTEVIPIYLSAEDGDGKEAIAIQINQAITQEGQFEYSMTGQMWAGAALGFVVMLGGIVCLFAVQTTTLEADRETGVVKIRRQLWFLPIGSEDSISIKDYRRTEIRSFSVRSRSGAPVSSDRVMIQTQSDDLFPLAYLPMFTGRSSNEIKKLLHNWFRG